jgi:hypothetical protein
MILPGTVRGGRLRVSLPSLNLLTTIVKGEGVRIFVVPAQLAATGQGAGTGAVSFIAVCE